MVKIYVPVERIITFVLLFENVLILLLTLVFVNKQSIVKSMENKIASVELTSQALANQILFVINSQTDLAFVWKSVKTKKQIAPVGMKSKKYVKKDPFVFSQVRFQM